MRDLLIDDGYMMAVYKQSVTGQFLFFDSHSRDENGLVTTETVELTTVKALINSTTSTPEAKFCCFGIKNFYLGTPMEECECIGLLIHTLPKETIQKYKLKFIQTKKVLRRRKRSQNLLLLKSRQLLRKNTRLVVNHIELFS